MLNRAALDWHHVPARTAPWATDSHPHFRIGVLFGLFTLAALTIGARFAWVQSQLTGDYAADFARVAERREPIPAPDGRIITSDGVVLAEDVVQLKLQVHYRWLEEPPDPQWLKQQAHSRLDRRERRQPVRVQAEIDTVLERREQLWTALAELMRKTPTELAQARHEIQQRVERIRTRAEQRLEERERNRLTGASPAEEAPTDQPLSTPLWKRAWNAVVAALTTPPRREEREPLIVREELEYHILLDDVDPALASVVETRPSKFPGTRICAATRRVYSHTGVAPHIVGVRLPVDEEQLQRRRQQFPEGDPLDFQAGDRMGQGGLEQSYERLLRGLRGERKVVVDHHGEVLRTEVVREPRPGRDVLLSLNLPLQQAAEEMLDDVLKNRRDDEVTGTPLPLPAGGALVAIDIRSGAILACVSGPRHNLNVFLQNDAQAWHDLQDDPRTPLFDRATKMTLPPGSIFKTLSAIAFLEGGFVEPEQPFPCQGFLDRPDQFRCYIFRHSQVGHGDVTLVDALARSCNVYFFHHARKAGPEVVHDWARKFGFGQRTGVDLNNEPRGRLPEPRQRRDGSRASETLLMSIGQSQLTATPLQIARLMCAVANGGSLVTPHFVDSTSNPQDLPEWRTEKIDGLQPRSLEWVRQGLVKVVADPHGTGYKTVRLADVPIAGKTGTAEPGGNRPDHAWFAGYVPANRPRIAFVVVLEHAGSGGHAAGPVARKFVQAMQSQGLLGEIP